MRSIYQRELGASFEELHPKIRDRFGFTSDDDVACIGRGTMDYVRNGGLYVYPFLLLGSTHHTMFPEQNKSVPFEIHNYAYEDEYGRETVTWLRTFQMPKERRFDAAMIYSEERDGIVDYLGADHHLAVDVDLSVSEAGGVRLRTGEQRFYRYGLAFDFPSPCPPAPTSTSGTTTTPRPTASASRSPTGCSASSSSTAAVSTWSGSTASGRHPRSGPGRRPVASDEA